MVVVHNDDYADAIKRLESAGFSRSVPKRDPPPEIMEDYPNPQQVLEEINAGYKRLDRSCAVLDYSQGNLAEEDFLRSSSDLSFPFLFSFSLPLLRRI